MKKILPLLFCFICGMGCQSNSAQTSSTLDVKTYQQQLAAQKDIQLIDVRTPEEFAGGHLQNAVNIDFQADDFEQKIKALNKTKPVYLYCLSGGRSGKAADVLNKQGFSEVYNMKGGIMEWKANALPLDQNSNAAAGQWIGMTRAEYDQLCQSPVPVLFDFKAKWCGPCKQLYPILQDIEKEYSGKVKIVPIDVDENKSLADELKIRSIPFMIFYKKGKHHMNIEGLTDKKNLIKALELR